MRERGGGVRKGKGTKKGRKGGSGEERIGRREEEGKESRSNRKEKIKVRNWDDILFFFHLVFHYAFFFFVFGLGAMPCHANVVGTFVLRRKCLGKVIHFHSSTPTHHPHHSSPPVPCHFFEYTCKQIIKI